MNRVKYPKDKWILCLQSSLYGKALTVYSCLSEEESANYESVKEAILKAYRLVPEAYRVRFRGTKKDEKVTYVEYGKMLEIISGLARVN